MIMQIPYEYTLEAVREEQNRINEVCKVQYLRVLKDATYRKE